MLAKEARQGTNAMLFLLSWLVLIPLAFFLSFQGLINIVEFLLGVAWFLSTVLTSLGFWNRRRTSQDTRTNLVITGVGLIFALSLLIHLTDAPAPFPPPFHLIVGSFLGVLGFLSFSMAEILVIASLRFFWASLHSTSDPQPLPSHLYQTVLFSTAGEALLLPFLRKKGCVENIPPI